MTEKKRKKCKRRAIYLDLETHKALIQHAKNKGYILKTWASTVLLREIEIENRIDKEMRERFASITQTEPSKENPPKSVESSEEKEKEKEKEKDTQCSLLDPWTQAPFWVEKTEE